MSMNEEIYETKTRQVRNKYDELNTDELSL